MELYRGSLHGRPRLFGTKLNKARLQFISLQERPKPILDTCRFGVVGTAIPRSWYRCSAYSVLQGAFIVDAGSTVFRSCCGSSNPLYEGNAWSRTRGLHRCLDSRPSTGVVGFLASPGRAPWAQDALNRCGQSRITLTESRLQHSGHRTRIEVFTMRKDTPSGLLERVMPAAGAHTVGPALLSRYQLLGTRQYRALGAPVSNPPLTTPPSLNP